jgi:hypothetical protein
MLHCACWPPEQHDDLGQQLSCFWQHWGVSAMRLTAVNPVTAKSMVAAIIEISKRFIIGLG